MQIDWYNAPKHSLEELIRNYPSKRCLYLDDILISKKEYRMVFQDILDMLKHGFEREEIRHKPVLFKIHKEDKESFKLQMNHFLSNLINWYCIVDGDCIDIMTKEHIYDFKGKTIKDIANYINDILLPIHEGDFHSKSKVVSEIWFMVTAVAAAFGPLMGMGLSIHGIIKAEQANPKIGELIRSTIDPSLQPVIIEQILEERTTELFDLFAQTKCDLQPMIVSGNNLNKHQIKEIFLSIAFKADINGRTIPLFMQDNILVTGLRKPSTIYIGGTSGRKALILSKQAMSEPGAFSKRVNLLTTSPSILRQDYEECDTEVLVDYFIRDDTYLRLLDKRYYQDENGDIQLLDGRKDVDKIGQTLSFYSPVTCSSKEGICHICYGELYEINKDLFSVGSYAATKGSNPLGQKVLSAKHEQHTESQELAFNNDFDEVFDLYSTDISIKTNVENDDCYGIVLTEVEVEETDDDEFYFVRAFDIVDTMGNVIYNIHEEKDMALYLTPTMLGYYRKLKDKRKPIPLEIFDDDDVLFCVEIKSKELTEPIKLIEKVLNRKDRGSGSISDVCQMLADAFIEIGIYMNFVHLECLLRALVRKRSNYFEFPDWGVDGDHEDFQILEVNSGLKNNPSPLVSLSYGYIREQLVGAEFYKKRGTSHLDPLFVRNLSEYID